MESASKKISMLVKIRLLLLKIVAWGPKGFTAINSKNTCKKGTYYVRCPLPNNAQIQR